MSSIDKRVVEMQFNNKNFENGVQTSINSLDKLKRGLNLNESTKSLNNLNDAGKSFSMQKIADSVETISSKFTTFGIIGVTALQNITNSVVNTGKQLVKSLSIDQVMAGWRKYEQKTASVQTIMNSTGKSIDEVNEYLNKLMWFSDETSYGFTDMTAALAQMTSSGGEIDDLIPLITGVANATAYAGKGAAEFSRAMYNLNQSYGSGNLQYMDWRSLELAGVAGKELKQVFIDTGIAMNKIKEGEVTIGNFGTTLSDRWADTKVMEAAFGKFSELSEEAYRLVSAGEFDTASDAMASLSGKYSEIAEKAFKSAQQAKTFTEAIDATKDAVSSGWMNTFEIIFGNLEEATTLWTRLTNTLWEVFASSSETRNDMLQTWKDLGGRDAMIEAVANAFNGLVSALKPIKEAFREIFPPMTGEKLYAFTKGLKELTEKFKMSDSTAGKVKRTFKGLFALLDLGRQAFALIAKVAGVALEILSPMIDILLNVTARIGDFIVKIHEAASAGDIFNTAFDKVKAVFESVSEKIRDAITRIGNAFNGFRNIDMSPLTEFSEKAESRLRPFKVIGDIFSAVFETIVRIIEWAMPVFSKIGDILSTMFTSLGNTINSAIGGSDFTTIFDVFNAGILSAIFVGVKKFVSSLSGIMSEAGGFAKNLTGILDDVRGCLQAYQSNIQAKTLLTIAISVGILAAALVAISMIDSQQLNQALFAITTLFLELGGSMAALQKTTAKGKIGSVATTMIGMSIAINILAGALVKLAALSWDEIARGTAGVYALAGALIGVSKALSTNGKKLYKGATSLVIFAAAILILAQSVKQLGAMDLESLGKGLVGVGALIAALIIFMQATNNVKSGIGKGVGLILLAAAIKILVSAVKTIGELDPDVVKQGLVSIGLILAELIVFMNATSNTKKVFATAVAMVVLGAAMHIFASAISKMGSMPMDQIGRGLAAMGGALLIIATAMRMMPKKMIANSIGLVIIASALLILQKALLSMSGMTWEEIAKGLVVLAGSMIIIAVALNKMKSALPGAFAMLVVAAALAILAPVLKLLGSMPLDEIGKGLLALAGVFVILGLAGAILKPLVPTILGLSVAILLLGIGIAAIGVGLLAVATGLTTLAIGGAAAAAAIVAILSGIFSLIPTFFERIGEAIIVMAKIIRDGAPVIGEAFVALIKAAMVSLVEAIPVIAESCWQLMIGLLNVIKQYAPTLISIIFDIIIGLFKTLSEKLPALIKAGAELLGSFIRGVFEAMGEYSPGGLLGTLKAIIALVACFAILAAAASLAKKAIVATLAMSAVMLIITGLFVILSNLPIDVVQTISDSLSVLLLSLAATMLLLSVMPITGAITAIASFAIFVGGLVAVLAVSGGIAQIPGLEWLIGEGTKLLGMLGTAIGTFVGNIVGGLLNGITGSFPQIGTDLSDFMTNATPFIEGAKKIDASVMSGVKSLAGVMLVLTAASLIEGLTSWFTGGSSLASFGAELAEFGPHFTKYYESIKDIKGDVVESSASAALALTNFAANVPNSGGLVAKITGDNSIVDFAIQLEKFGPKLMNYSNSIKSMNSVAVTNSASAALALTNFAANIPNSGGLVAKITGDNSIVDFADQLVLFGPKLMSYSNSIKSLNSVAVTNSADAALALTTFANEIPNGGGLVAKITGDNNIVTFAEELEAFGPHLMAYAACVKGLDVDTVTGSANAALAVTGFAENVPKDGGVFSWFTGTNNIADFGANLAKFGSHFAEYYDYIKDINTDTLGSVITQFIGLADMAGGVAKLDSSKLTMFSDDLAYLAQVGVRDFVAVFEHSQEQVKNAINAMIGYIEVEIQNGTTTVVSFMDSMVIDMVRIFSTKESVLKFSVENMMNGLTDGISGKKDDVVTSMVTVIISMADSVQAKRYLFVTVGESMGYGVIEGIERMAEAAATAGSYFAEEMVQAIDAVVVAGINAILQKIADGLENRTELSPTIRPVLDLSNIRNGSKEIRDMLDSPRMSAPMSSSMVNSISGSINDTQKTNTMPFATTNNSSVNFTQNITSPRALSTSEITRQTRQGLQLVNMGGLK